MKKVLQKIHTKKGMTTIELVVVFGIFAALATTVLFSYREFSANIKLQNLSQDIALQIRQAQNRSVSGSYPVPASGLVPSLTNWTPSYGLYFSTDPNLNNQFVLFFDQNSSAVQNPTFFGDRQISVNDIACNSGSVECLDVIQITTGEYIDKICLNEFTSGDASCASSVGDVHIVFSRPLNRAYISDTANTTGGLVVSDVSIYIKSPTGPEAVVRVTAAGQIIVE